MPKNKGYKIIQGEQRTKEWRKMREMKITGSIAKQVKGSGNSFLYELLAKFLTGKKDKEFSNEHIERGINLEPQARIVYEEITNQKVEEVAFIESESGKLGLSPDGVIFKGKNISKLIEIKCPDTNTHIKYIVEGGIPKEYRDQIIHAFIVVDDLKEMDFISYDPKFKLKPIHIVTIRRIDLITDITTTQIQYDNFLKKFDETLTKLISL